MGFYDEWILPHLTHLAMRNRNLAAYRRRAVSGAEGRVLEIGIGSGLNLPLYSPRVREIIGIDPSPQLIAMAERQTKGETLPVRFIEGSAEEIPLDDASIDTVITTWTLCSIPEAVQALREARRVMASGGQLLFVEHGRSPDEGVRAWQDRLTPLWKRIGGGCHLNRPINTLIESAGFGIDHMDTGYAKGPRPMAFMYEGRARP